MKQAGGFPPALALALREVYLRIRKRIRLRRPPPGLKAKSWCWIWTGATTSRGYGSIRFGETAGVTHRLTYQHLRGPIPEGMVLDHLCRRRACCNPAHAEAVTNHDNTLRGYATLHKGGKCIRCSKPRTRARKCAKSRNGVRYDCEWCEIERHKRDRRNRSALRSRVSR